MLHRRAAPSLVVLSLVASVTACGSGGGEDAADGAGGVGGGGPAKRRYTFQAIGGVSMGAMGASFIGSRYPERFDAIGSLGGPMDFAYLLRYVERYHLGGFCSLEELERILAENPGDPDVLNDPARLPCMGDVAPETGTVIPEHAQSFPNWVFTTNGGTFDRDSYLELLGDLSLAFGNPLYANPDAPALPPGVTREALARGAALCDDPIVLEGFHNREYNPRGAYPVITFCDGDEPVLYCRDTEQPVDFCATATPEEQCADAGGVETATKGRNKELFFAEKGRYDPCYTHRVPAAFALAVDLNRNGRRDYGEPIVANGRERFSDVGADGCANELEDGRGGCVVDPAEGPFASGLTDPNGDDFRWDENPVGTERDWLRQEGEPFDDDGLDGVAGTSDLGEGDGAYSQSPNRDRFFEWDARTNIRERWTDDQRAHIATWMDGGIRDLFNFGVTAAHIHGELAHRFPDEAATYTRYFDLPGNWEGLTEDDFDPFLARMTQTPRHALFLYGDPDASPLLLERGDGDHVGTPEQTVNRFYLFLLWLSHRWDGVIPDPPGDNSEFDSRAFSLTYRSEALGGVERDFAIVLPPGYDAPQNADVRYPVLYMGHGYGMEASGPDGFYVANILYDLYMADGKIRKMIMVYPSGRCCFRDVNTGARVCTERDADGNPNSRNESLQRECSSGTFYVDRAGYAPDDDTPYAQAFLELMDHVNANYRTLPPAEH